MNPKVPRRALLQTLGAAALTGTGCNRTEEPVVAKPANPAPAALKITNRVNLICHGMMMFWYQPNYMSGNFITILIPKPPKMGAMDAHDIALSEFLAGRQNRLKIVDPTSGKQVYRQGLYELILESSPATFTRANSGFQTNNVKGPDKLQDVVLNGAQPLLPHDDPQGGSYKPGDPHDVWFRIRVPYPTNVYRYRVMDLKGKSPYDPAGTAAKTFGIKDGYPGLMAGVHVFSYENVPQGVKLRYYFPTAVNAGTAKPNRVSDSLEYQTIGPVDGPPELLNIHLYSQAPTRALAGTPDERKMHLPVFNEMVSYTDYQAMPQMKLDLTVNPGGLLPGTGPQVPSPDLELSYPDIADLAELLDPEPPVNRPAGAPVPPDNRTYEPVECLQGWGT